MTQFSHTTLSLAIHDKFKITSDVIIRMFFVKYTQNLKCIYLSINPNTLIIIYYFYNVCIPVE